MRNLKSALLCSALTGSLVGFAAQAQAQQATTELEEVVVTGIRASINASVEVKKTSTSIVEVISAEDIGKLPDASIGESLARLPGLATQRFDGRASKISIRGLAPDFTNTTLNGREMVSSDNNRAAEFDQFPSELINGATVYKTPDAGLFAQALGGTVDMQTVKPLAYGKRAIIIGARGEVSDKGAANSGTSAWGYRGNATYIDQNDDGTIGWALGYSRMVQPIQEQHIHYWGYDEGVGCASLGEGGECVPYTDQNGNDIDPAMKMIRGIKPYVKSNKLTRDGVLGVLEFQPNEQWHSRIDAFYSKFKDEQTLRGEEIPLDGHGNPAGPGSWSNLVVEDGMIVGGTAHDVFTMGRNDFIDRDVETYAFGWNTQWQMSDRWSSELDVSYSKATRDYASSEIYISDGRGKSGTPSDFDFMFGGENGVTLHSDRDFSDPSVWKLGDNLGWGGPLCGPSDGWSRCNSQDLYRNTESSSDDMLAIKLAAKLEMDGAIKNLKFGGRFSERNKHHQQLGAWAALNAYPGITDIPADALLDPTSLDFVGLGNLISFDPRKVWNSGLYGTPTQDQFAASSQGGKQWSVKEKVVNLFVQADFEAGQWAGNLGLQAVLTDQSSHGFVVQSVNFPDVPTVTEVDQGDKFMEFLPSLNATYNFNDDNKLRFSVARILARPRMDQMHATRTYGFDIAKAGNSDLENSPWSGEGGNPNLRPWMAWQFDSSFETYFGKGGYASVAAFYKKLETYVFTQKVVADFSGVSTPLPAGTNFGLISAPANGNGGKLYGLELSASLPFGLMTDMLDGFGFLGSASFTKSSVRETPDSESTEIPGLSKNVLNGTLYYEQHGFQARVSARYRSSFLAETFKLSLDREEKRTLPETIIDAQVSYDLSEVGVEGLTLYLQGSNLTDEPFVTYEGDDSRLLRNYHTYGRNFMFGATYKF